MSTVPKSEFSRSQKRGGIKGEVKRGEVVRELTGLEGERGGGNEGKKGGRKGARKHTRKMILVPL